MRVKQKHDPKNCPDYVDRPHAHLLRQIDAVIEETPQLCELVYHDLSASVDADRGRRGMTARQVLGAAITYHLWGDSYEDLAFRLADSSSYRRFCRVPIDAKPPGKSTLQENIVRIRASTWESICQVINHNAQRDGIEDG